MFTTHIGAYEPTVMYFGLINSPTTFQTMMNDLFRDLINQEDTATFIDDILVATDTEEGHNELVEVTYIHLYSLNMPFKEHVVLYLVSDCFSNICYSIYILY